MEFRKFLENEYQGKEAIFENILMPVFGKLLKQRSMKLDIEASDKKSIESMTIFGSVDGMLSVLFVDVELSNKVQLSRNRVSIQNCVRRIMEELTSAIIFFHYKDDPSEWRISFVFKGYGEFETTQAKRYTYLCGLQHPCRTASERFENLAQITASGKKITDTDMIDAFAVEALSKEFFDEYKKQYEDFVEYISGKRFVKSGSKWTEKSTGKANKQFKDIFAGDDKQVRDFVKKMLGRIVFLYFLQKKGWLGVAENEVWGSGDKNFMYNLFANSKHQDDYLEKVLKPLFFETLNNADRDNFVASEVLGSGIKIPYLNGGLFESDESDKKHVKFSKTLFNNLFDFFARYNFTIDETDPTDTEIGVDPEMLGKIFENLLEDNKDKGAFYTPKEIVQYMCRESLIAYLSTGNENITEQIRNFVGTHDTQNFTDEQKSMLLLKLKSVKICDPAVGSGAFPMGMMNELLSCRTALEDGKLNRAQIKKEIVQNNIYGVDIEKGAVDIARLRFWLAIVVDEDEPLPLPNLDYKIMQGNSLLECYEGEDLSNLTQKHIYKVTDKDYQTDMFGGNDDTLEGLVNAINGYYEPNDHEAKLKIREQIKDRVIQLLRERNLQPSVEKKLKAMDLHSNSEFFLWHTWFSDVFNRPTEQDSGGFDIVIGNPPYVKEYTNKKAFDGFRENSPYYMGKMDLWYGFACHGLDLLSKNGILAFIAQNNWTTSAGAKKMRNKVITDAKIYQLLDFNNYMIFESADIQTMVMLFTKNSQIDNYTFDLRKLKDNAKEEDVVQLLAKQETGNTVFMTPTISRADYKDKLLTFSENNFIFEKIANDKLYLNDEEIAQGIVPALDDYFIVTDLKKFNKKELNFIKPFFTGVKDRYIIYDIDKYLIYMSAKNFTLDNLDGFPNIKQHFEPHKKELKDAKIKYGTPNKPYFYVHRERNESFFREGNEKIAVQVRCEYPMFIYTSSAFYGSRALFFIRTIRWSMKFLTGLFNSKLVAFWCKNKGKQQGKLIKLDKEPLMNIPIPQATTAQQKPIIALVEQILAIKNPQITQINTDKENDEHNHLRKSATSADENSSNSKLVPSNYSDTSELEKQIDLLVYKLYGLSFDEAKVIDPELTEDDF